MRYDQAGQVRQIPAGETAITLQTRAFPAQIRGTSNKTIKKTVMNRFSEVSSFIFISFRHQKSYSIVMLGFSVFIHASPISPSKIQ